jgi:hypothetical protein
MQSHDVQLTAQARLLSYPPLWCWEIVDSATGLVVASSWENASEVYDSASEALREAGPELRRLARGHRAARRPPATPPPMALGA